MDKKSKVSKTQTKGDEPILDASTSVAQTSVVEPTTPGDHDTTTGVVKPTPAKNEKKPSISKKPTKTKQNKKGPLEDEIPEMVRSPPNQTPLESSQKDHVVSTGKPHQEADLSLERMHKSPSPRAMSLSTPQPSPSIPRTFIPLLNAIEPQIQLSSSQPPIIESTLPQVSESEQSQSANPQASIEEATPLEFQETLGGSSSEQPLQLVNPLVFSWKVVTSLRLP
ncbi:RNA polymerase II degradation factor 1-like [Helianthus annuus]|uniref:RNA polymerase II degradation factor 1-like n=1 Tax=Helianthus annuus TaxID=4232 RepID=UPI000B8FE159|nr:RNA polymerase II degradation factor 1-like [Helianthus annuus]